MGQAGARCSAQDCVEPAGMRNVPSPSVWHSIRIQQPTAGGWGPPARRLRFGSISRMSPDGQARTDQRGVSALCHRLCHRQERVPRRQRPTRLLLQDARYRHGRNRNVPRRAFRNSRYRSIGSVQPSRRRRRCRFAPNSARASDSGRVMDLSGAWETPTTAWRTSCRPPVCPATGFWPYGSRRRDRCWLPARWPNGSVPNPPTVPSCFSGPCSSSHRAPIRSCFCATAWTRGTGSQPLGRAASETRSTPGPAAGNTWPGPP